MFESNERLLTKTFNYSTIEHLHRYALALEYVVDKVVLDLASGEGYGSNLLATSAKLVHGVDLSSEAIEHSKKKYSKDNLFFTQGNAVNIPFENESFDVVVSFETIEHHDQHNEMMQEILRVLKKDGILIISSPDKLNYSDKINYKNEFHVKELYSIEFFELLSTYFKFVTFLNQKIQTSSLIVNSNTSKFFEYSGNFEGIEKFENMNGPVYNIAICSNIKLIESFSSSFDATGVIEKLFSEKNEILNSKTYKLGNFIALPFRVFMQLFKK